MFLRSHKVAPCLLFVLALFCSNKAWAANAYWTGLTGGDFSNQLNWSTLAVPTAADSTYFTNNSSTSVLIDSAVTNATSLINSPLGVWDMNITAGSSWVTTNTLTVGQTAGSSSTLSLTNGGLTQVAGTFTIGSVNSATGTVSISSGNLVTTNGTANELVQVGTSGIANMTVSGGGNWLGNSVNVGNGSGSYGTLTISGGTVVVNSSGMNLGNFPGSTGAVFLTGGQLVTTNSVVFGAVQVARQGVGNMTVSGGSWIGNALTVANLSGSQGTLNFSGGTNVFTVSMTIGAAAGATGVVNITAGNLTVTNAGGTAKVVVGAGGVGALTLNGGTLTVNQLLVTNGAGSSFSASGGSLAAGSATIGGSFSLTNSTGTISGDLTVTPSGSLSGTNGVFALFRNGLIQSTNQAQFNLTRSTVLFTNGAGVSHTLSLSNSLAVEMGPVGTPEIQTLRLSLSNNVTLTGMKSGATTNALYVGWLDLSAWNTNAGVTLTNTLLAALSLPDINLYYDAGDTRNAYLQDASYALWGGGGLLIPIPEPSVAGLVLGGALFSTLLLWRRKGRE